MKLSMDKVQGDWEEVHCAENPDAYQSIDWEARTLPANPVKGVLSAITIRHPASLLTDKFPKPNLTWTVNDPSTRVSIWYLSDPVEGSHSKHKEVSNLYLMVRWALRTELEGIIEEKIPNPSVLQPEGNVFETTTRSLREMKILLQKNGLWGSHMPPEFLRKGGLANTEAQKKARKENFAKAREAARAARLAKREAA